MKEHIKGFAVVLTFLLAIIGACQVVNLARCGLETCPVLLDRQTVVMLQDQKYLLAEAEDKFEKTQQKSKK